MRDEDIKYFREQLIKACGIPLKYFNIDNIREIRKKKLEKILK